MADTVTIAGKTFPKKAVVGGIVLVVAAAGFTIYKKREAANSAASQAAAVNSAAASDAGTSENDPATGFPLGSPEDEQALADMQEQGLPSEDDSSYVSGDGNVIGYDEYGDPIYGAGTGSTTGPGSFVNNAQWAQYVEQYMGSDGDDSISAAIGKYISGQGLTSSQVTIVQEAISAGGDPPVAGSDGYPPSYKNAAPTSGTPSGGTGGAKPGRVGGLKVTDIGDTSATLSWSPVSGATGYMARLSDQTTPFKVAGTSVHRGGLKPATRYSFTVYAVNKMGNGPSTTSSSFVTTKGTAPKK
jgi:hypothetical protein